MSTTHGCWGKHYCEIDERMIHNGCEYMKINKHVRQILKDTQLYIIIIPYLCLTQVWTDTCFPTGISQEQVIALNFDIGPSIFHTFLCKLYHMITCTQLTPLICLSKKNNCDICIVHTTWSRENIQYVHPI